MPFMRGPKPASARLRLHAGNNLFVNLSLFFVSTAISVIVLDFLIKFILPVYDPRGMLDSKYYLQDGVRLCPKNFCGRQWKNTGDYNVEIAINKYGFRDRKDFISAKAHDFFSVGDSFSFGSGVEEKQRYCELAGEITGVSFYNISIPGACAKDYQALVKYARDKGAAITNLMISICMENDIRDYGREAERRIGSKNGHARVRIVSPRIDARKIRNLVRENLLKARSWMSKNTALYHAGAAVIHQNDFLRKIALNRGWIIGNYEGMYKNRYSERDLASTVEVIADIARPFRSLVVIIPSRALWVGDNRSVEDSVHNKFVSLLKESGASVIDLRACFEQEANPLQYYFKQDGHWNQLGHAKAARAIAAYLSENRALYNYSKDTYN